MAVEHELGLLRAAVAAQSERVRTMKKAGQSGPSLEAEVSALVELKKSLSEFEERKVSSLRPAYTRCRTQLENLAKRRSFFFPAFEIYGGVAGLFDWGPPGCAVKAEVEALWRRHFVLHEDMLEFSGTCLTPHAVLKASGHVDRFCDLMTVDTVTGDCYRADKLLEDFLDVQMSQVAKCEEEQQDLSRIRLQADSYSAAEMHALFQKLDILSPGGHPLSMPFPFNLMFKTRVGPKEQDNEDQGEDRLSSAAYLRPETAQGIFVNFRRLLESNAGKLPFAAAQLGLGFRNEIAPRNALLRVREFQMGEIEHFVDPQNKSHARFEEVAALMLPLFPRNNQLTDGRIVRDVTLRAAVHDGVINNETLA